MCELLFNRVRMNIPSSDPVVRRPPEGVDGNIHTNGLGFLGRILILLIVGPAPASAAPGAPPSPLSPPALVPEVEKRPPCSVELTDGAIYFFCKLPQRIVMSGTAR